MFRLLVLSFCVSGALGIFLPDCGFTLRCTGAQPSITTAVSCTAEGTASGMSNCFCVRLLPTTLAACADATTLPSPAPTCPAKVKADPANPTSNPAVLNFEAVTAPTGCVAVSLDFSANPLAVSSVPVASGKRVCVVVDATSTRDSVHEDITSLQFDYRCGSSRFQTVKLTREDIHQPWTNFDGSSSLIAMVGKPCFLRAGGTCQERPFTQVVGVGQVSTGQVTLESADGLSRLTLHFNCVASIFA